jgi:hypothetical protein
VREPKPETNPNGGMTATATHHLRSLPNRFGSMSF